MRVHEDRRRQGGAMSATAPGAEPHPRLDLERTLETGNPLQLARLLGDLELVKASVWQRLVSATITGLTPVPTDPIEDLRHLAPRQVAEVLSLKPAYVHELCRTGRIPATKSGKYWMIPVEGLRRWLAYQNQDVDGTSRIRLDSLDSLGDTRWSGRAGATGRARKGPVD